MVFTTPPPGGNDVISLLTYKDYGCVLHNFIYFKEPIIFKSDMNVLPLTVLMFLPKSDMSFVKYIYQNLVGRYIQ